MLEKPPPTPSPAPSSPAPSSPAPFTRREQVVTLTGLLLGIFLAALDQTIVATAGPQMQRELAIAPSLYAWITTAYLVTSTMMIPIYGKLGDIHGRRTTLLWGVAIFLAGSLLCGIAGEDFLGGKSYGVAELIAFRALQGVGGAVFFPTTFAVIGDMYPPAERGKYTGLVTSVFAIASILGPLLGGFLTDQFSWRWVFYVNLPFGLFTFLFILRMPPLIHRFRAGSQPRIDYAGAFFLCAAVVPLLSALSMMGGRGIEDGAGADASGTTAILFAVAVAGFAAFLVTELRAHDPIVPLGVFRSRVISIGTVAAFIFSAAFLGPIVFLPLFMVYVIGASVTDAGLILAPFAIAIAIGSTASGFAVTRLGSCKPIMLVGLVLLMAAYFNMVMTLSPSSTLTGIVLAMTFVGLPTGLVLPLFNVAVQNAAQPREMGAVVGTLSFLRNLGQAVGVALLGTVFAGTYLDRMSSSGGQIKLAMTDAVAGVFTYGLALLVLTFIATVLLPNQPLRRRH
ncbi:MAG: drug resistance transporter, EmrB/QacA subfamily [Rhodospirillales bacterium]|jgi:EmrB/QacA subfamily drug resistance transporter|nr:drug resistance transporter, EmrB/QacA subfamily [Rhodospirillales bacterium]